MKTKFFLSLCFSISLFYAFSQNAGIKLEKFKPSECLEEDHFHSLHNRIVLQEFKDNQYFIEIAVVDNCCIGEFGNVTVTGDTLKLSYKGHEYPEINAKGDTIDWYSEVCDCNCCFHFKYQIKGLEQKHYIVLANNKRIEYSPHKYRTKPVKYDIVNGDTINYYDIYGFKQGCHIVKNKEGKVISKMEYIDDKEINGIHLKGYYDSGEIRYEIFIENGEFSREIEYFKNGQIKMDCEITGLFDDNPKCKEFDEQGNQVKSEQ